VKTNLFGKYRLHHAHFKIARGMFWVLILASLSRMAALGREAAFANRYGTGPIADAYLFVTKLIIWPVAVWFGVLSAVLIPVLVHMRVEKVAKRQRVLATLLGISLVIGGVIGIGTWLLLPSFAASSVLGLSPAAAVMAGSMTRFLWPLLPLGFGISLYSVWIMATGNHANTLIEGIPSLVIMAAVLLSVSADAGTLVWSTLVGAVLQFVALAAYVGRRGELSYPSLKGAASQMQTLWLGFGFVAFGQALSTTTSIFDQVMAAPLGAGSIAILGYANRILILLNGLAALVITRAALPIVSVLRSEQDSITRPIVLQWAGLLFVLGILAAIFSYWIAPTVVPLLFEGGAFTADDSAHVIRTLSFGLPQIPFFWAGLVLTAHLAATRQYAAFAAIGAANMAVKIVANLTLIPQLGIAGIPLGSAVMYAISTTVVLIVTMRYGRDRG
jgi:peptidoglycan biosynthesis protein MviN/MurJ (putative lipid II flippase)